MKPVILSILYVLAASGVFAQEPEDVRVSLILEGKAVALTAAEESTFTAMAIEALRSSTSEADSGAAMMSRWTAAGLGSRLRVTFVSPRPVELRLGTARPARRDTLPIQELLLPVTRTRPPDYIFIRSRGRVRAFANFGPLVARLENVLTRFTPDPRR